MSFNEFSALNRGLAFAMENYAQLMMLLIITCLGAYAAYLCWQLLQQKKIARLAQAVLKRQRSESHGEHQESISVLIRCLSQGQVSLTLVCSLLLPRLYLNVCVRHSKQKELPQHLTTVSLVILS